MVLLEAQACGVPVIAGPRAGGRRRSSPTASAGCWCPRRRRRIRRSGRDACLPMRTDAARWQRGRATTSAPSHDLPAAAAALDAIVARARRRRASACTPMIVAFLRHGRTAWNDRRADAGPCRRPALGRPVATRCNGGACRASLAAAQVVASPLARARETAALLGAQAVAIDDALVEMDWGDWEGETLDALKAGHGAAFDANCGRGLDFRPPGGESPRDVQQRIVGWLVGERHAAGAVVAVTHQGRDPHRFSRLITGWDMVGQGRRSGSPTTSCTWSRSVAASRGGSSGTCR